MASFLLESKHLIHSPLSRNRTGFQDASARREFKKKRLKKRKKQSTVRDPNYYLTNLRVFGTNYFLDCLKGGTLRHTVAASLHLRQILYSLGVSSDHERFQTVIQIERGSSQLDISKLIPGRVEEGLEEKEGENSPGF